MIVVFLPALRRGARILASAARGRRRGQQLSTTAAHRGGWHGLTEGRTCRQRGQAMVEYVIVVALVAVAAIAVYQLLGQVIRSQTAAMAREIAGEDGTEQSRMAQTAAEAAAAQTVAKSLKSFTGNADAGQ